MFRIYSALLFLIISLQLFAKDNIQIGAYYFDGWSGHSYSKEAWAKNAPTNMSYKLLTQYSNRKPIWGWRDDNQTIMDEQIQLASKNGINFFSFCWYWSKDEGNIDSSQIINNPLNTGIRLFRKSKIKKEMKFSLLIANHQGFNIKTKENWIQALTYIIHSVTLLDSPSSRYCSI